jgi:hypothetical protein
MGRSLTTIAVLTAALLLTHTPAAPAAACGGCFHVPNPMGTPTAVNAHRMVIVVAPGQTILWDQIVYEGDPSDFVWVLPVAPGASSSPTTRSSRRSRRRRRS